ncbi:hypothetical protein [Kribbella sp. VKM Ac-2568]|uniref:hypothetical protein n=1 Tax=Kribbella sp. VKM Ac-2568 TaxID=2512219 RepID=UPI001051B9EE|nr:hypothetical protein [Kribbella sp. VKM Ac-2568]TCM48740.1 hypothetical protein EV648_1034 [Kribbella sp. VKM Ac-2568]
MSIVVSPDGLVENEGTAASPWSLETGLTQLANGEDVLYLRGGIYVGPLFVHNLTGKVICSYPGEHAIIDGTLKDFRDAPNDLWDPVVGTDSDEYVSKDSYDHDNNNTAHGSFLDRVPHTRLITHQFLEDLQSENEKCGRMPVDQAVDGPQPADDATTRRPWVYMGPGIFQDDDGFIHVRLSPTHNNVACFPDYDGETDPRNVPLAIWTLAQGVLRIVGCAAVQVCDITVRHGDAGVVIEDCNDVRLDHVEILAGPQGIRLSGKCVGTVITHCLIDGGLPPWYFRSDRKDEFKLLSDDPHSKGHAPGENTTRSLLAGNKQLQGTKISFCEFINGHDNALFGNGVEFSRNWVKNMNDDAIIIDTENAAEHHIFGNVIEQCQTAISSGSKNAASTDTLVYRNLIDLRHPFTKSRPRPPGTVDGDGEPSPEPEFNNGDILATGTIYKSQHPDGPLAIFQNTIVVKDRDSASSFGFFRGYQGEASLRSYNNVFVAVNTIPNSDKPIGFLPDPNLPAETNGNAYYRAGQYIDGHLLHHPKYAVEDGPTTIIRPATDFASLAELRGDPPFDKSLIFADTELTHPPGYEKNGIDSDPRFRDFDPAQAGPAGADDMRLASDSPALHAGVVLPVDLRDADGAPGDEQPDIGFLPYGSPPLAVGVDGRRTFPRTGSSPAVPD